MVSYEIELQRAIAVRDIFRDRATGLARMDLVNSVAVLAKVRRDPNVVDLGRILMLFDLRLKVAADGVNKWRRERVCGHGFYFSPTEDDRLARLRRGFFFTSVRCAIFSIVPRRMYSRRIFSSISSRRSYSRFGFLRGPRLSA